MCIHTVGVGHGLVWCTRVKGAWPCVLWGGGGGYVIVRRTKVFGWFVGFFWGASYLYNVQEPPKQAVAMNARLFWYAAQVYAFFARSAEHKAV